MPKKTYTVSTRLQKNSPLVCYMEDYITEYNQIYRYAWQVYISKAYSFATDSKFRTHLCEKFGILGRTANSILRDIKGTMEAYLELKKTEIQQLERKIEKKQEQVEALKTVINGLKLKIANNTSTKKQLEKYRIAKQRLYSQQNKLNKMEQQRENATYQLKEKKKWYLQVLFTLEYKDYETVSANGVLGLDYNDGFIEVSETDEKGNLIGQHHYDLKYHGTGKKAKTEIEQVVSQIVNLGKRKGKTIVIEDLNFKNTKAKQTKGKTKQGKAYNRILHKFDYSRYKKTLENCSHRKKVELLEVNPKNTSKIGKQKYSNRMKLSVHQAASYVIARKGQGYQDRLVS